MKPLTLFILVAVSLCASLAYGYDCWITEETLGFRDWKALEIANDVEVYKKLTGDPKPQIRAAYQLEAEGRSVDLTKGERAELVKVSQLKEVTVMEIKVGTKGTMWIFGIDLECR